jgi:hypothetical protein
MSSSEKKSQVKPDRMTKAQILNELHNAQDLIEVREKELSLLEKQIKDLNAKKTKLTKQLRISENRIVELEKVNEDLDKKIADLQNTEETIPKDFSVGKSAFRIELYPRQGDYGGKIEHLLTRDKKGLNGLDSDIIMAFISDHLPRKEEDLVETQYATLPAVARDKTETTDHTDTLHIRELNIIPTGAWKATGVVPPDNAFHIQLTLDPSSVITEQAAALNYHVSIYAKRLEGGLRQIIGETKGEIKTANPIKTKVAAEALPPGTYRFEAIGKFNLKEKPTPINVFRESSLISVL